MQAASERYVVLRNGSSVPAEPVILLIDLEARGFKVTRAEDDICVVPFSKLGDEDRQALKVWKPTILNLLDYIDETCA
jgi:hypothetical protein